MDSLAVGRPAQVADPWQDDPWLRRFHPAPRAATALVVFAHAGGSASYFHRLSELLRPDVDVFAVQYPGRQDRRREPCLESVDQLAEGVLPSVQSLAGRPFALFGHSLGASVAFEVARRLEDLGRPASMLFASGRPAPQAHRSLGIHRLGDAAFIDAIRRMQGTDLRLLDDPEVVAMVMPSLRADYRAAETYSYRPGPPLSSPIVGLQGVDDPYVSVDEVRAWVNQTRAEFELFTYPGGHFYLADHWAAVADTLRQQLSRAAGSPGHDSEWRWAA